jgi:hypothetical protein
MKIALVGSTGNIGSKVLAEALGRRHLVIGITRDPEKLVARDGLTVKKANTHDVKSLAEVLRGNDAVIVAVKWTENDVNEVIEAVRESGVKRALFVVGAGSLLREDGRLHYDHMIEKGTPAPSSKPAMLALEVLKKVDDLDWSAISPSAEIMPGERTGVFRLGLDHLIQDAEGRSRISREDFAIAILDEIEKPQHIRQRFTAGY